MNWASSEVVGVLTFLLPGFVAAAIFYSLTSHPRPGAFDRVIQALIFTVIGQAIVALILSIDSTVKESIQRVSNWEFNFVGPGCDHTRVGSFLCLEQRHCTRNLAPVRRHKGDILSI